MYAPSYNEIVEKEVDCTLQTGIITPIESERTYSIVLETKKDGSPRFCIDFRKLNAVMKSEKWPVPCAEEIFDDMRGSSVFTTPDLFKDSVRSKWMKHEKGRQYSYADSENISLKLCLSV